MSPHEEFFHGLLDQSAALLAAPESAGITIPDDELHREIIVPLLPAMLGDRAIRQHWNEQAATGFVARLARHFGGGEPAPRWLPGDFEIHVTASYSAGADARALADTLLSEESLRDLAAVLMNQILDVAWPSLASVPSATPAEPRAAIEIAAGEIATPAEAPAAEEILQPIAESVPAPSTEPLQIAAQKIAAESEPVPTDGPPPDLSQPAAAPAESRPAETDAHAGGDPFRGLKVWRGRLGEPAIFKRYSRAMW